MQLGLSIMCLAKRHVTTGMHQQAVSDEHQAREVALGLGDRKSDKKGPANTLEGPPTYLVVPEGSAIAVLYYRRYKVSCLGAHHRVAFKEACKQTRNAGPAQTAIFGDTEPLAFLGARLAAGEQYATREDRLRYTPQEADVVSHAVQQGWDVSQANLGQVANKSKRT